MRGNREARISEWGMTGKSSDFSSRPSAHIPQSSIRNRRSVILAVAGAALVLGFLPLVRVVGGAPAGPARPAPGAGAASAPAPAATTGPATDERETVDEGQRLLSEQERARGAMWPGRDPAYIVLPRPAERRLTAQQLLAFTVDLKRDDQVVTATVEEMTERMVKYLLKAQAADGSWSDTEKDYQSNTGVTGLCCLALMAGGDEPNIGSRVFDRGKKGEKEENTGKALTQGLEFLLRSAKEGGAITGQASNPMGPMYEQCYATQALLYGYGGMPWRRELRDVISHSVQLIERNQKLDGGWRYNFTREGDSDVSVTCNVLWVLRSAKKCGFTVSAEKIKKAVTFVERCGLPEGGFRYRLNGRKMTPSMGGAGIVVLCGDGSLNHPMIPETRERIAYDYRRYTIADLRERRYTIFNTFYASLAMYMTGDEYWVPFFRKVTQLYADMQRRDGEVWDEHGNTIYPTAMAAIVLQAPLGYLPIYER